MGILRGTRCLQYGGIGGVLGFAWLGEGAAELFHHADIRCIGGLLWIHAFSVQSFFFAHKLRRGHLRAGGYVHLRIEFRRPPASGHADHRQIDTGLVVQHCSSINNGFKHNRFGLLGPSTDCGCLVRSGLCLCRSHGLPPDTHPGHPGRSCQLRPQYDRLMPDLPVIHPASWPAWPPGMSATSR